MVCLALSMCVIWAAISSVAVAVECGDLYPSWTWTGVLPETRYIVNSDNESDYRSTTVLHRSYVYVANKFPLSVVPSEAAPGPACSNPFYVGKFYATDAAGSEGGCIENVRRMTSQRSSKPASRSTTMPVTSSTTYTITFSTRATSLLRSRKCVLSAT